MGLGEKVTEVEGEGKKQEGGEERRIPEGWDGKGREEGGKKEERSHRKD